MVTSTPYLVSPSIAGQAPSGGDWPDLIGAGIDSERLLRYRQYLDFYQGLQWEQRRRRGETRITANYARTLVRKGASYVFPSPVTFSVAPADNRPASDVACNTAELTLNEISRELDLPSLDFETMVDSSVLGDGAFKVTWDDELKLPNITAVDPAGLFAWAAPDNVRRLVRVAQRYELLAEQAEELFRISIPQQGNSRVRVIEDWTPRRFRLEVAGIAVRDEPNPYGWIPYVIFPNLARPHEIWGDSDLVDLMDVCRELNRRLTVLARILQVSGNPIVVLENVQGSDGIRADEGAVWELPEDSKAYLLDMLSGGGVRLHVDYIEQLYKSIHDLAETPRTAFGDSGRALSGTALEVELQPLIQKVQRKRRTWDRVYRQRNRMILDLMERFGGRSFGGARLSTTVWGDVLPSDRDAAVKNEVAMVAAQIHSRRTAMANLGNVDVEREWALIRTEMREQHQVTPGVGAGLKPAPTPGAVREEAGSDVPAE